ncbi:hypothetical protein C0Q70_04841 [Pomacea canaliculata]|uniref:Proline-rich transmembrane protein 1 n=1 Tax=Pomacea canaliculata TaxID=400727 RepID=A0A2T7PJL0_POMCA|nr:proline-rich transmembrane protein 1-like isoform X3 [Pomacea canaliculata]PVD33584.1 hypothetical protein C0Q70_04841 [Pomacea canaliculata]
MDSKQGNQSRYPQQGNAAQPQQGYSYNHNSAVVVTQPVTAVPVVNSVPDNMGLAIFTTICCCWPIGLFAIMKASQSRTALASGDTQRAQNLSQESRRLSLVAIAFGCVAIVIVIIAAVVSATI